MVGKKVVVFAVDGASWNILETLVKEGLMPNLKKLTSRYKKADLISSIPPATFPAWINFLTGTNPGEHGISGLVNFGKKLGDLIPLSGYDRKSIAFPEILDKNGIKAVYINLPGVFPVRLKNAKALSSFIWTGDLNYYPSSLVNDIPEVVDYKIFPDFLASSFGVKDYIDEFIEIEEKRFELSKKLFLNGDWQFFFHLVSSYDWFFHKMRDVSIETLLKSKKVRKFFKMIDGQLGWFLEKSQRYNFIIMSDHGEKRYDYKFYANRWLAKNGYLKIKKSWYTKMNQVPMQIKFFNKQIYQSKSNFAWIVNLFQSYPILYSLTGIIMRRVYFILPKVFLRAGLGQWGKEVVTSKSKAYFNGYYIQFKGTKREKKELVDRLKKLKVSQTDELVFSGVYLKEDVYFGKNMKSAPDILAEWQGAVCDSSLWSPSVFLKEVSYDHQKRGIFVSNLAKNIKEINIEDVSSLILKQYGLKFKN